VGSLPHDILEEQLRAAFEIYGRVESVFVRRGCERGRQWAFVTFALPEEAQHAKERCDRVLKFPGADKPCDVMLAKNQGMRPVSEPIPSPTRLFVSALPDGITDEPLRAEFGKFGEVTEVFLQPGCQAGQQWALVTHSSARDAQVAKVNTDRILFLAGSTRPCEVMLLQGQGPLTPVRENIGDDAQPRKIFVGSLPDHVTEDTLRAEFSRYGRIVEIFLRTGRDPGRQWAFVTFSCPEEAASAKQADRTLVIAGAERPCEVTLARNQGLFGQAPLSGDPQSHNLQHALLDHPNPLGALYPQMTDTLVSGLPSAAPQCHAQCPQTPNVSETHALASAHGTAWRCYHTTSGIPYYHNHNTGETTWEVPIALRAQSLRIPTGGCLPEITFQGPALASGFSVTGPTSAGAALDGIFAITGNSAYGPVKTAAHQVHCAPYT